MQVGWFYLLCTSIMGRSYGTATHATFIETVVPVTALFVITACVVLTTTVHGSVGANDWSPACQLTDWLRWELALGKEITDTLSALL